MSKRKGPTPKGGVHLSRRPCCQVILPPIRAGASIRAPHQRDCRGKKRNIQYAPLDRVGLAFEIGRLQP